MLCSRRAVLGGMGLAVLSPALVACSGDPEQLTISISDVPVGSGVIAGGYVITQPVAGTFEAFDARCPHANVQVTSVEGDRIHCKPHDAWFEATSGRPLAGPTDQPLASVPVVVEGDQLLVGAAT